MRNIFDQYGQPENRLTHALACCLEADHGLMTSFIQWATGAKPPRGQALHIVEQSLPGQTEAEDADSPSAEAIRRSLPDAWIYADDGWSLLIESKVALDVDIDQLRRHIKTAQRRTYDPRLLVLTLRPATPPLPGRTTSRTWSELYQWAKGATSSEWAARLTKYMEVAERKMLSDEYIKGGYTLTTFSGIAFEDNLYAYPEAKRLLQLAMQEIRKSKRLTKEIGADLTRPGRPAITGTKAQHVWDLLHLDAKIHFQKFPHLTLGIERDRASAQLTLPNGFDGPIRRHFASLELEGVQSALTEFVERLAPLLKRDPGATPYVLIVQRRYASMKSEPKVDARIEFDPRTAIGKGSKGEAKLQVEWLRAAVTAYAKKKSNLNLSFGVAFEYGKSNSLGQASFVSTIEDAWIATKPILSAIGLTGTA